VAHAPLIAARVGGHKQQHVAFRRPTDRCCRKSSSRRRCAIPDPGANSESEKEKLNRDDDELLMHTEDR
jgi:hypothetical protein